jgi:hypothetical protein
MSQESDLFKIINLERITKYRYNTKVLYPEERNYFKYYVNTFRMEVISAFLTLPMM